MISRNWIAKLLNVALGLALMIGLFPVSNLMSSMQTMRMDAATSQFAAFQGNLVQGNASHNSAGSCCDATAPFSTGCAFFVPQSTYDVLYGGNQQIVSLNSAVQSNYIETVAPPPKA